MTKNITLITLIACIEQIKHFAAPLAAAVLITAAVHAAEAPRVALPDGWENWERYAVSSRGSVIEDMYAPRELIAAMKTTDVFPYGSKILLVEYANQGGSRGPVRRYIVMQKEKGWGAAYPEEIRNGEWEYQAYHGDRRPFTEAEDPVSRCLSCHHSAADSDYVYSAQKLRAHE